MIRWRAEAKIHQEMTGEGIYFPFADHNVCCNASARVDPRSGSPASAEGPAADLAGLDDLGDCKGVSRNPVK